MIYETLVYCNNKNGKDIFKIEFWYLFAVFSPASEQKSQL